MQKFNKREATRGTGKPWLNLSLFGICVFFILYVIAAFYYPGGSQADKGVKGFSWLNNYWCDLLSERSKNGTVNSARPVAIISWIILCFSLSVFWYFLPRLFAVGEKLKGIIRFCGIAAMFIALFLFTSLHDWVIQVAGALGLIAFIGTFFGLYKSRLYGVFCTGLFCFVLMALNYAIMMGNTFISSLPLIQKITFVIVLAWIVFLNRKLVRLSSRRTG